MKKFAFHIVSIAYVVMFVSVGIQLYLGNGKIEKNIVKIVKEAEIVQDYQNNLEMDNNNLGKNIFSGFFIDNFIIITASHGLNKDNSVYNVFDYKGNEYKAFVKEIDSINDIAYLEINKEYKNYSKVKYTKEAEIGDSVYILNFNNQKKEGIIKGFDGKKISSNIVFEDGDSGSPLLNSKNRIIGINIEKSLTDNTGISYSLIEKK